MSKSIEVVAVPDLSPEQERLLRERFDREDRQKAQEVEEFVFTNVTNERQFIPDLGIKTGDRFHPESILAGTTVDLSKKHRIREIKASKYLQMLLEPGVDAYGNVTPPKLVKGRVGVELKKDPLNAMANMNPSGTFNDPDQERYYDKRLRQMEDKEDAETGLGKRITTRR